MHQNVPKCMNILDLCGDKAAGQLETQIVIGPGNYRLIAQLFVLAVYDYGIKEQASKKWVKQLYL